MLKGVRIEKKMMDDDDDEVEEEEKRDEVPNLEAVVRDNAEVINASSDYHMNVDLEVMKKWFYEVLLPLCLAYTVIVLDHAKYHAALDRTTVVPRKSSSVKVYKEWLTYHNIDYRERPSDAKASEYPAYLRGLCEQNASTLVATYALKTVIDEYRAATGNDGKRIELLFSPICHCMLNPIENAWGYGKSRIRNCREIGRTLSKNMVVFRNALESVVASMKYFKFAQKCVKEEDKMYQADLDNGRYDELLNNGNQQPQV